MIHPAPLRPAPRRPATEVNPARLGMFSSALLRFPLPFFYPPSILFSFLIDCGRFVLSAFPWQVFLFIWYILYYTIQRRPTSSGFSIPSLPGRSYIFWYFIFQLYILYVPGMPILHPLSFQKRYDRSGSFGTRRNAFAERSRSWA